MVWFAGRSAGQLHSLQPSGRDEEGPAKAHAAAQNVFVPRPLRSALFKCQVSSLWSALFVPRVSFFVPR